MGSQTEQVRYWVIVPAAGVGRRMGSSVPKQYLPLARSTVLSQTLYRLSLHPLITQLTVVIGADDPYWPDLDLSAIAKPINTVIGGDERCHSVFNGLMALSEQADENDWVLVHDAARPCIRPQDIANLMTQDQSADGALLGVPVRDTMKQVEQGYAVKTINRDQLWHALTPQMFRYGKLYNALNSALTQQQLVTDEAMAMEQQGYRAHFVEGCADNIKITRPEDLALAEFYLQQQVASGIVPSMEQTN